MEFSSGSKGKFLEFVNRKDDKGVSAIEMARRLYQDLSSDFLDEQKVLWNIASLFIQCGENIETRDKIRIVSMNNGRSPEEQEEDREMFLRKIRAYT